MFALGACALAAVFPSGALAAGTVDATGSGVQYNGDGGVNNVTVSYNDDTDTYTFTETGISQTGGCVDNGNNVTCVSTLGMGASLDTGADSFTVLTAVPGTLTGINAGDGVDTVTGGPSREVIVGEAGTDTLSGNGGDDIITGGADNDVMDGGDGADDFEIAPPNDSAGSDTIQAGAGDDQLGPQTFGYGPDPDGPDDFHGGPGSDTADYSWRIDSEDGTAQPISVTEDNLPNDGGAGEGDNIHDDVEVVLGTGKGDTIIGGPIDNTIEGNGGDDQLGGGAGNDTLNGGTADAGSDSIDGGEGNDTATGGAGDDSLLGGAGLDNLDGGGGTDTLDGGADPDSAFGGAGIDTVSGGGGDDTVQGGVPGLVGADGADGLNGGDGNDNLIGDAGDDNLDGGLGADAHGGGDGIDTADYQFRFDDITVTFDGVANDGAPGEGDNVGTDVENVRGGGFDDTLTGTAGSNVIDGKGGEDYTDGRAGADELAGGENGDVARSRDGGPDHISCGPGPDFVVADGRDKADGDCERVDAAGKAAPKLGRTAAVKVRKGIVGMSPARIRRFVPLADIVNLPVRSRLDATDGAVVLQSAKGKKGGKQSATFQAGIFQVLQSRSRRLTDVVMAGGNFGQCKGASSAADATPAQKKLSKKVIRRLRGNAKGSFRTRGRHSSATVRGTKYTVIDRCDGTLTKVTRGKVAVRDFRRKKTVIVRTGKSYLARAGG